MMKTSETNKNASELLVDIFSISTLVRDFGHGSEVRVIESPNKKVPYKDSKQQKELLTTNTHGAKKKNGSLLSIGILVV